MSQLKVDTITDEEGTGAPNFPRGVTLGGGPGAALVCDYGGTADAITLTSGLNLSSVLNRLEVVFFATAANTGAMTADLDGTGPKPVKTVTGADTPAGYIRLGNTAAQVETRMRFSAAEDCWIADRVTERGSNSNGEFTRWANGTQICTDKDRSTSTGTTWTFPSAFIAAPAVVGVANAVVARVITADLSTSATSTIIYGWRPDNESSSAPVADVQATGRWY